VKRKYALATTDGFEEAMAAFPKWNHTAPPPVQQDPNLVQIRPRAQVRSAS
jgi:hypothetical protein